ncbi:MAG: hypothetical protein AAFY91_12755, partial [Bacteroidota bacterium]
NLIAEEVILKEEIVISDDTPRSVELREASDGTISAEHRSWKNVIFRFEISRFIKSFQEVAALVAAEKFSPVKGLATLIAIGYRIYDMRKIELVGVEPELLYAIYLATEDRRYHPVFTFQQAAEQFQELFDRSLSENIFNRSIRNLGDLGIVTAIKDEKGRYELKDKVNIRSKQYES